MRTLDQIEKAIGPIPRGPIIGGETLSNDRSAAVVDPATEEILTEIALGGVEDAVRAVDAAESAMPLWNDLSPRHRSEILRRAFDLMMQHQDALARLIVLENGKAYADAAGEVAYAAEFFRWYAEEAVRLKGEIETAPSGANRIMVLRQPIGVSLLITPWNFPAAMATRKMAARSCSSPPPRRR